ncbi:MAG: 50S ribosomal protein L18 [candidate division Zixibacteria bacterium]|nr:50S ribosomal protein L18 [candidate division Zixibacteria bacterium]
MADRVIKKQRAIKKRRTRIRGRVFGSTERPRLTVKRSAKHVYAQIIDDVKRVTLASAGSLNKELASEIKSAKSSVEKAKIVGKALAAVAKERGISKVVFDRNGCLFHGRIKALADGARAGGLDF